jgi:putative ATP-dependent endonuclease of the OLD family
MALRSLRVECFRGIRSAELAFDTTTILIGENDCGRSSLLEALALALSPDGGDRPAVGLQHVHRAAGDGSGSSSPRVRIQLTFGESRAGSWDRSGLEALLPILGRPTPRPRTLVLEITADPAAGALETHWTIQSQGGDPSRDDVAALSAVRRMNPLVWLRGGRLVGTRNGAGDDRGIAEALTAAIPEAADVLHRYASVLGGSASDAGKGESGFAAAGRMLDQWAPGVREHGPGVRAVVTEILGQGAGAPAAPLAGAIPRTPPSGSAAQQVGVFLVTAQLVRDLERTSAPGARPIIVVEEPEAHLHPMTMASVWALIERFSTQKIVTTNSGTLLAVAPLRSMRRLVRDPQGRVREWRVRRDALRKEEMRKVGYHLRARRGVACFARCWLLVEGETEFWVMPDLARLCGFDLAQEGVVCVEFAQCGLPPLVKLADSLGIRWHVLVDGDRAGESYAAALRPFMPAGSETERLTRLAERDIEHCFWRHGHSGVFEQLAGFKARPGSTSATRVIHKAIERPPKPGVAFALRAAVAAGGAAGPPPPLRGAIETCVRLAQHASEGAALGTIPATFGRRVTRSSRR